MARGKRSAVPANAVAEPWALPKGWRWERLGDVCHPSQYGWTTSASSSGRVKFVRTTDISSGMIDWGSVPYCMEAPDNIDRYTLSGGDILISRAGSVGKSFLVKDPEPSVFASYLIRFRPLIERIRISLAADRCVLAIDWRWNRRDRHSQCERFQVVGYSDPYTTCRRATIDSCSDRQAVCRYSGRRERIEAGGGRLGSVPAFVAQGCSHRRTDSRLARSKPDRPNRCRSPGIHASHASGSLGVESSKRQERL